MRSLALRASVIVAHTSKIHHATSKASSQMCVLNSYSHSNTDLLSCLLGREEERVEAILLESGCREGALAASTNEQNCILTLA
jgi:hypothetical protein